MKDRKVVSWICLPLICVTFCRSIQASVQNSRTMTEALPAYALSGFSEYLNISRCRTEMEEFRQEMDRRTFWALRMLDASGQTPSGFMSGHNYWFGSRHDCEYLSNKLPMKYSEDRERNNSLYRNKKGKYPPYKLNFFTGNMRHNSFLQSHSELAEEETIVLGLCLPATCTEKEVATMLNKMLENRTLFADELYSMNLNLIGVSDLRDDHQWLRDWQKIVILFILFLLLAVVIVGTLYDIIVCQARLQGTESSADRKDNMNGLEISEQVQNENDDGKSEPRKEKLDSGIGHYFVCFSLYTNVQRICAMNRSPKNVDIFDGMKVLSVLWVDLVHNFFFLREFYNNPALLSYESRTLIFQILYNGTYVVDTFFFISGYLTRYNLSTARTQRKKAMCQTAKFKQFCLGCIYRYIRLAPVYYILVFLSIMIFSWQKQISLFNGTEVISDLCSKYWWRNFLFINNLFDWDDLCMNWTWYVPNDMQFFIFASFLLLVSITHRNVALGIGVISVVGSIIANGYIAYDLNYIPSLEEDHVMLKNLYMRPWLRVPPYLIGMGTCLLLEKWNHKLNLSKKAVVAIWSVVILLLSTIIFVVASRPMPLGYSVFYTAVSRACWGLSIGWIVIACTTNNGGFIEKILSWKVWYPFSKLSYTAYLLNPFVIILMGHLSNYPILVDSPSFVMFFGTATVTYIAALVLSAAVEVPFVRLLRIYI